MSSPCLPSSPRPALTASGMGFSSFLLWECAYAELTFTPVLWPDFDEEALSAAVNDYRRRDRRYGRVVEAEARG